MDQNSQERSRATLVRASQIEGVSSGSPGRILQDGNIACGTGLLEIVEIQPENKRPMPLKAFCNGHAWTEGMHLEST
jgi:methionyl-tRNA formyltransferase